MKKIILPIIISLIFLNTNGQTSKSQTIKVNEVIKTDDGNTVKIIMDNKRYTLEFWNFKSIKLITASDNAGSALGYIICIEIDKLQYIWGSEFLSINQSAGSNINIFDNKLIENILAKSGLDSLKSDFAFFNSYSKTKNYLSYKKEKSIQQIINSLDTRTGFLMMRINWRGMLCPGFWCMDSICACTKNALCKLADCLEANPRDASPCRENVREVQACNGSGFKVQIKSSNNLLTQ